METSSSADMTHFSPAYHQPSSLPRSRPSAVVTPLLISPKRIITAPTAAAAAPQCISTIHYANIVYAMYVHEIRNSARRCAALSLGFPHAVPSACHPGFRIHRANPPRHPGPGHPVNQSASLSMVQCLWISKAHTLCRAHLLLLLSFNLLNPASIIRWSIMELYG